MAARHGKYTGLFFDGYDFTGYLNKAGMTRKADVADASPFGVDDKVYVIGLRDGGVNGGGMFDGNPDAIDEALDAILGSDTPDVVTFCPDGVVVGRSCHSGAVRTSEYSVSSPATDVVGVSLDVKSDGPMSRGAILAARAAATASGNGTGVDNGAATTDGGVGFLHLTANTRDGSSTIKVQHSVDNGVWVDLLTFTAVAAASLSGQRVEVGGTVNRYLRAQHTPGGSTGSLTYTLAFARN